MKHSQQVTDMGMVPAVGTQRADITPMCEQGKYGASRGPQNELLE